MKKIVTLLTLTLFCAISFATPVSKQKAHNVAFAFLSSRIDVAIEDVNFVYSQSLPTAQYPAFYVFNVTGKAFVIVSGDDIAEPILGYSFKGDFSSVVPEHVESFLSNYAREIDAAVGLSIEQEPGVANKWNNLLLGSGPMNDSQDTVGPLLTSTWEQEGLYNSYCPSDTAAPNGRVPTGCVATAMSQIIRYWQYPVYPRGSYSYISDYGQLSIDFDTVAYVFDSMPDILNSYSSDAQIDEVAKLMYHCGVAVNMIYGPSFSGATNLNTRAALINHFRFNPSLSYVAKIYNSLTWNSILKNDLDQGRPILYTGSGSAGGHAFVCDGYTGNYFHFNFGWLFGIFDGYYLTSAIDVILVGSFNDNQVAIVGIVPDSLSNTIISREKGFSSFVVNGETDYYNTMALNQYTGFGNSYSCSHLTTFRIPDSTRNIALDIVNSNSQNLYIYDGENTNILLRHLDGTNSAADLAPVTASSNALTILDSGSYYNYGFHVVLYEDNGCRKVTNVQCDLSNDSLFVSWTENGSATSWQVEYGTTNFNHGEGNVTNVDTNFFVLTGISDSTSIDLYVRSVCDSGSYGSWSEKINFSMTGRKWIDVVTLCPDGYSTDASGNVTISSAEGLAWLISVANGLNGQTSHTFSGKQVSLVSDVDMGAYKWTPINNFSGTFNGNGHTVYSINIDSDTIYQGFIGQTFYNDCYIKNLNFANCNIKGTMYVGVLAGSMYGIVENCSANGTVQGSSYVGGLIGSANKVFVTNCSSSGVATATNSYLGGLIGYMMGGTVKNCFTTVSGVSVSGYAGGLIGYGVSLLNAIAIKNSYAGGTVLSNSYRGSLIGYIYVYSSFKIDNCYARRTSGLKMLGNNSSSSSLSVSDTASFNVTGSSCNLLSNVSVSHNAYSDLNSVLNAWIVDEVDTTCFLWQNDNASVNFGCPIFADRYHCNCLSPENIVQDTVWSTGATLSWDDDGADSYAVEYGLRNFDLGTGDYQVVQSPNISVSNLMSNRTYEFYVRSICSDGSRSEWSKVLVYTPTGTTGISDVDGISSWTARSLNGAIVIENAGGLALSIFDVDGRQLYYNANPSSRVVVPVPSSGIYFIHVEGYPAKKIVVLN